jgi:hypothetical protein
MKKVGDVRRHRRHLICRGPQLGHWHSSVAQGDCGDEPTGVCLVQLLGEPLEQSRS